MGVIRVPTKITVYKDFMDSHKIQKNNYCKIFHPSAIISQQTIIGSGTMLGLAQLLGPLFKLETL